MKRIWCFLFLFPATCFLTVHAQIYQNGSRTETIKTLTVYPDGDWSKVPVLTLGSENSIQIAFDELSHNYIRYGYRIIHCNADWTRSEMNELEYLDGFPDNEIDHYEQSVSTLTEYTHYSFSIPNDKVQLKLSGNYAVEIYDRENNGETLLTACFMVLEEKAVVEAAVTATTDIDHKQQHQQLSFDIKPVGLSIRQPLSEVKVTVQQNHRRDNEVRNISPLALSGDLLRYEHNKDLIFKAGNEYRRFEMTTVKYAGLGVEKISYFKPFYHVELRAAEPRTKGYTYDKDQNGRFLIHSQEASQDTTGSDYFLVHFSLPMDNPILDGGFFINGDLTDNTFSINNKMIYNFERKAYEKSLLLKEGTYNYQYVLKPSGGGKSSTEKAEGSYWETENEYQIYVYYRPVGERYDRLIGFRQIQTSF
jgi:hypothetical protein